MALSCHMTIEIVAGSPLQWFDPWRWQLEEVVYLDENSWTHTNLKDFVQVAKRLERT